MKFLICCAFTLFFTGLVSAEDLLPVVIDVRSDKEWAEGHLEQAIHIPHTEIEKKISDHVSNKSTPVVLYCRSGGRAGIALKALKKLGYTNIKNLGGLEEARKALGK